jgi:GT2 family glycosyltransferase
MQILEQKSAVKKNTTRPTVSIILLAYNALHNIQRCLDSLLAQDYLDYEIIAVDNASSDGSADYIARHFPEVKLIQAGENLGFGSGNNLGAHYANGEYLVFLNLDTTVEPDWLSGLITFLNQNPTAGMVTPKLLLMDRTDHINTCGNNVHISGYGYLRGWLAPASAYAQPAPVSAVSGAAFAMSRELFFELHGFDPNFFPAYAEETDLSLRARLMGHTCWYIPDSIVYHDYESSFSANKYKWIERNRTQMLLKLYRWPTLIMLLPALLLAEVVSWGYAVMNGGAYIRARLGAYRHIVKNWSSIMAARRHVQHCRKVQDREIIKTCVYRLGYAQAGEGLAVKVGQWVFDPLFWLFHRLMIIVLRW